LLWLLPVSVAVNIGFALVFTDSSELLRIQSFTPGFFILAAVLRLIPWFTKSLRLHNWMKFLKHPFSFWDGVRISMMSELGAAVSPTAIGGEPVKTGMLYQRGVSFGESASLTSIAAAEDLTFYILGLPVAIWLSAAWEIGRIQAFLQRSMGSLGGILLVTGIALAAVIILWIAIREAGFLAGLRKRIRDFWNEFRNLYFSMVRRGKIRFAVNVLLSAVHWGARYSVVTALVLSLGYEVDAVRFFVLQWVVFTVMSVIPTPGATGGAEGVFLLVFGAVLPEDALGTILIGWRFLDFYFLSILALLALGIDTLFQKFFNKSGMLPNDSS